MSRWSAIATFPLAAMFMVGEVSLVRQQRSVAILIVACVAVWLFLNLPYQLVAKASYSGGAIDSPVDFDRIGGRPPVMAGWPYRYWVRYADGDGPAVTLFAVKALLIDIGIGLLVGGLAVWYARRRLRAGQDGLRRISIADILAVTLVLAAALGWWQRLAVLEKRQLEWAATIARAGGSYTMSAWVPDLWASRMPDALLNRLRRIRSVRIEHPSDALLHPIVAANELTLIRLGGGQYDVQLLNQLAGDVHLTDLRIAGRRLGPDTMDVIATIPRLQTLNLVRTDATMSALEKLPTSGCLRRINLIHSDVDLAELDQPPWFESVEELRLGHPMPGETAELKLAGWPRLRSLSLTEFDSLSNSSPMRVRLEAMPKLQSLKLDVFQKFSLTLRDMPALKGIEHDEFQWQARIPRGGKIPGRIWCDRIDIRGAPELEELFFFTCDLQYFRITAAPKFKTAGVAAFYRTYRNSPYETDLAPSAARALIEGLGKSEGPANLDLDAVPLAGVDLTPLVENQAIRELKMSYTGTKLSQWKPLAKMQNLTRLDLLRNKIDSASIKWVIDTFPKLESLYFSPADNDQFYSMSRPLNLSVIDRPNLRTIDTGEFPSDGFSSVRIIGSPQVAITLKLATARRLELIDANGVTGLAVRSPLDENVKLSGLHSLAFFAVGGPNVTDQTLEAISQSQMLNTLTIAYPSASAAAIAKLPVNAGLSTLCLPGTPIDDEVVMQWPTLPYLSHLDLRDTKITERSIAHLCSTAHLDSINLDRTKVQPGGLAFLADNLSLREISLVGVGIDAASLEKILGAAAINFLDLSDSEIAPEVLSTLIASGRSIQMLALRNCQIDEAKLLELSHAHRMKFDLEGTDVSTKLMTQLLSSERVADVAQWRMQQAYENLLASVSNAGAATFVWGAGAETPAMLDVDSFAKMHQTEDASMLPPFSSLPSFPVIPTFTPEQLP